MKAFVASFKRLIVFLSAMQAISWLYGLDDIFHEWVKNNYVLVTFTTIAFLLVNWIFYDSWNEQQKRTMLTPPKASVRESGKDKRK